MPAQPSASFRVRPAGIVTLVVASAAAITASAAMMRSLPAGAIDAPMVRQGAAPVSIDASAPLSTPVDLPPPASGATGTIALPDIPVPADAMLAGDGSVRPAQPFVLRGGAIDRARALQCLTTAIYYEAANEPDDGQAAVAQVVLNRVRHPAFPPSVCGVVFQGSEKPVCQFSFACDGALARAPSRTAWERSRRAAAKALAGAVFAPVGLATHYHTYAVTPAWNRTLVMTGVFGAHFFHRWKGWWGTSSAFRQSYSGVEPLPAPHPRDAAPTVLPSAQIAATVAALLKQQGNTPATAAVAPASAAQVQPAYRGSGAPQPAYAASRLPETTMLDKWKGTGQLLQ
jgi:hypothetical protein